MFDLITEFVGTFIFLSVILTTGEAIPIGLALAVVIFFGGKISGGHFNPAVSTMMLVNRKIGVEQYIGYVLAQILGGLVALWYVTFASRLKAYNPQTAHKRHPSQLSSFSLFCPLACLLTLTANI